jgi:hypothetical protein
MFLYPGGECPGTHSRLLRLLHYGVLIGKPNPLLRHDQKGGFVVDRFDSVCNVDALFGESPESDRTFLGTGGHQ